MSQRQRRFAYVNVQAFFLCRLLVDFGETLTLQCQRRQYVSTRLVRHQVRDLLISLVFRHAIGLPEKLRVIGQGSDNANAEPTIANFLDNLSVNQ